MREWQICKVEWGLVVGKFGLPYSNVPTEENGKISRNQKERKATFISCVAEGAVQRHVRLTLS